MLAAPEVPFCSVSLAVQYDDLSYKGHVTHLVVALQTPQSRCFPPPSLIPVCFQFACVLGVPQRIVELVRLSN